jgi:phosphatidyl-myo-inositol dimannoside synthase
MPNTSYIFITHEFYPRRGGIATFVEEMAGAATRLGLTVEVWAPSAPVDTKEKTWPFTLHRLPLSGSHDLICQFRLARDIIRHRRRLRHAVVYLVEPGPMLTLMWLQFFHAFRPNRLLLTFHGSEILKFRQNPLVRSMARKLIAHAERISTLTNYTRNLLADSFPDALPKTVLTPGALRSELAKTVAPSAKSTDRLVILTVGRLHPRKGQRETLTALAALPAEVRSRLEYWIVGTANKGDYEAKLRHLADQSGLKVKFLGDPPDGELGYIYEQADVFALTSMPYKSSIEGFGLVYLEASAHGLPIIAHDIGGVREAVIDGVTGLLVPHDQPKELTRIFRRLIDDADLRRQLGVAGRPWARQTSWKDSAELLFAPIAPELAP